MESVMSPVFSSRVFNGSSWVIVERHFPKEVPLECLKINSGRPEVLV